NHTFPSGPAVMTSGLLFGVGVGHSLKRPLPCAGERAGTTTSPTTIERSKNDLTSRIAWPLRQGDESYTWPQLAVKSEHLTNDERHRTSEHQRRELWLPLGHDDGQPRSQGAAPSRLDPLESGRVQEIGKLATAPP